MATTKNLCCVCRKNPVCECSYFPRCEDESCKAIYHLCFSGVADGTTAAKNSSRKDLEFAFNYLLKSRHSQKTLRVIIAREIGKRIRSEQSATANSKSRP